jgi:hypothetical protein
VRLLQEANSSAALSLPNQPYFELYPLMSYFVTDNCPFHKQAKDSEDIVDGGPAECPFSTLVCP